MKMFLRPGSASAWVMTGCARAVAERKKTKNDGVRTLALNCFMETPRSGLRWSTASAAHAMAYQVTQAFAPETLSRRKPSAASRRPHAANGGLEPDSATGLPRHRLHRSRIPLPLASSALLLPETRTTPGAPRSSMGPQDE